MDLTKPFDNEDEKSEYLEEIKEKAGRKRANRAHLFSNITK